MLESGMVKEDNTPDPPKGLTEIYCSFCDGKIHEVERTDKLVCDEETYCVLDNEGISMSQINREDELNCDRDAYCRTGNDETSLTKADKTHGTSGPDKSGRDEGGLFVNH